MSSGEIYEDSLKQPGPIWCNNQEDGQYSINVQEDGQYSINVQGDCIPLMTAKIYTFLSYRF